MKRWCFLFLLLFGILSQTAAAQVVDGVPVDVAVKKLEEVTRRMTAYLHALPTFRVDASTRWTLDGKQQRTGGTRYSLWVKQPGAFRLEVNPDSAAGANLVCVGDGTKLTRLYRHGRNAIYSQRPGGFDQLLDDAMTDGALKGSGLDLLARPDSHSYMMASVADLKDLGEEEWRGRKTQHFSASWFGGSRVEFWIAADREPVLLRWQRQMKVALGGMDHEVRIDSDLVWTPDTAVPPEVTPLAIPPGAVEVKDLQAYLLTGGTSALLGRTPPRTSLKLVDGGDWNLEQHLGNQVVVLFFFATWAAPSTDEMPSVTASIQQFADRGVTFYAIDAGEAPETVRAFVAARKYSHPVVLDPDQQAASAYRVTSLPATILIGKDGTLQAAHVGFTPEIRALIRQELGQLLDGKLLVDTSK